MVPFEQASLTFFFPLSSVHRSFRLRHCAVCACLHACVLALSSHVRKPRACSLVLSLNICPLFPSNACWFLQIWAKKQRVALRAGASFCTIEGSRYLEEELFPLLSRSKCSPTNEEFVLCIACPCFKLFSIFENSEAISSSLLFSFSDMKGKMEEKEGWTKEKEIFFLQCRWLPQVPITHLVMPCRNH